MSYPEGVAVRDCLVVPGALRCVHVCSCAFAWVRVELLDIVFAFPDRCFREPLHIVFWPSLVRLIYSLIMHTVLAVRHGRTQYRQKSERQLLIKYVFGFPPYPHATPATNSLAFDLSLSASELCAKSVRIISSKIVHCPELTY